MGRDVRTSSKQPWTLSEWFSKTRPEVAAMDEKINHYFISIRVWLQKKSRKIQMLSLQLWLLQVIAFLERIGIHAKNICEMGCLLWNR